jgi:hypothetical protein
VIDRRADPDQREWLERLLTQAAEKGGEKGAMTALNTIFPHDMNTKSGLVSAQDDLRFGHQTRVRCERFRDKAWLYGGFGFLGVVVVAFFDRIAGVIKGVLS